MYYIDDDTVNIQTDPQPSAKDTLGKRENTNKPMTILSSRYRRNAGLPKPPTGVREAPPSASPREAKHWKSRKIHRPEPPSRRIVDVERASADHAWRKEEEKKSTVTGLEADGRKRKPRLPTTSSTRKSSTTPGISFICRQ